jgi:8-oxo-dGTP diphosphatase
VSPGRTNVSMDGWEIAPAFGVRTAGDPWVIRPSAYGLIPDPEGRVAVVRSVDGVYLPGGGMEAGETPEDAIRREALEECGFAVRLGSWTIRAVQFAYSASEKAHFEKRSTFIECSIEGIDRTRLHPDHEVLWVDAEAAEKLLNHASHGWAVREWQRRFSRG